MHECLLCKRDMKIATTIFGSGCIKSIYKLLDLKISKNVKVIIKFNINSYEVM